VWRLQVESLWEREPRARVYLAVLDGCSYPVFLELLHALAQDSSFPVGIRPDAEGRVAGLPALAPLPTVTSHARGALFLGELPRDPLVAETVFRGETAFRDQEEAKTDKARFQQDARLGERSRRPFLKADLTDGGQALLAALADDGVAVVAAVFNAVDDQIGSSNTGSAVRLAPEDVTAFKPSLKAAFAAGRRVLVTADHGHSPFVDRSLRVGSGKAPRWTALEAGEAAAGEAAPESFLEIDVGTLGGPPERRAFAWRADGQASLNFLAGLVQLLHQSGYCGLMVVLDEVETVQHPHLRHAIVHDVGWRELRPVQELAIDAVLDGCNAVVLAPTAGGKTEAAIFPVPSRLLSEEPPPVAALWVCVPWPEIMITARLSFCGARVFVLAQEHIKMDVRARPRRWRCVARRPSTSALSSSCRWLSAAGLLELRRADD
jgi:hypothetical protein